MRLAKPSQLNSDAERAWKLFQLAPDRELLETPVRAEVSKRWLPKLLIQHGALCPSIPQTLPQNALSWLRMNVRFREVANRETPIVAGPADHLRPERQAGRALFT